MKIEKLSDTQIKLTLTRADLKERNIDLEELIKPSEKTQELFRDIMEQAFAECGFSFENTPLMVEAAPVSVDGLMIIVTKLPEKETQKDKVSLISQNKDIRRYKKKPVSPYLFENTSDEDFCVYSFENLDIVSEVSLRLSPVFTGFSSLYKLSGKYFLLVQNHEADNGLKKDVLELILNEYGQKHISGTLSKYHLSEHGEVIVKNNAVNIMATL